MFETRDVTKPNLLTQLVITNENLEIVLNSRRRTVCQYPVNPDGTLAGARHGVSVFNPDGAANSLIGFAHRFFNE